MKGHAPFRVEWVSSPHGFGNVLMSTKRFPRRNRTRMAAGEGTCALSSGMGLFSPWFRKCAHEHKTLPAAKPHKDGGRRKDMRPFGRNGPLLPMSLENVLMSTKCFLRDRPTGFRSEKESVEHRADKTLPPHGFENVPHAAQRLYLLARPRCSRVSDVTTYDKDDFVIVEQASSGKFLHECGREGTFYQKARIQ